MDSIVFLFWEKIKSNNLESPYVLEGIEKTNNYSKLDWESAQSEFDDIARELQILIRYKINPIHITSKNLIVSLVRYINKWFFTPDEKYLYFLKQSMQTNKEYWYMFKQIDDDAPEFIRRALEFHSSSSLLDLQN
jgi:hypothetical protein